METKEIKNDAELKKFLPLWSGFEKLAFFLFLQLCLLGGVYGLWTWGESESLGLRTTVATLAWVAGLMLLMLIFNGVEEFWKFQFIRDYWKRNVIGYRLFCKWIGTLDELVTFEVAPWSSKALHCKGNYIVLSLGGWCRQSSLATYGQYSWVWSIHEYEIRDGLSVWVSIRSNFGDVYRAPLRNIFRFLDELPEITFSKDMDCYISVRREEREKLNELVAALKKILQQIVEEIETGNISNRPLHKTKGGRIIQKTAIDFLLKTNTLNDAEKERYTTILEKLRSRSKSE